MGIRAHHTFAVFLLSVGCAYGQMTVIGGPATDPEVKPEQRTATILHYERVRTTARRSISILALALQNEDGGSKAKVAAAINNEQDIVDSANWCIRALRDKSADAVSCAFPTAQSDGIEAQGICQAAENARVRSHCSQVATSAKRVESSE